MGVASLVLGIVSLIVAWIPFCGVIALVPAIIGLILGIVDIVKKSKADEKKGMGIAGTVLSAIAIAFIIFYFAVLSLAVSGVAGEEFNNIGWNEIVNTTY